MQTMFLMSASVEDKGKELKAGQLQMFQPVSAPLVGTDVLFDSREIIVYAGSLRLPFLQRNSRSRDSVDRDSRKL